MHLRLSRFEAEGPGLAVPPCSTFPEAAVVVLAPLHPLATYEREPKRPCFRIARESTKEQP